MQNLVRLEGRQKVGFRDMYCYWHKKPIENYLYDRFIPELRDTNKVKTSAYYKWLKEYLDTRGKVFGTLETDKDIEDRTRQFRSLIKSIYKDGYKFTQELCWINGLPYGSIVGIKEGNKIYISDGFHRLSILKTMKATGTDVLIFKAIPNVKSM